MLNLIANENLYQTRIGLSGAVIRHPPRLPDMDWKNHLVTNSYGYISNINVFDFSLQKLFQAILLIGI